MLKMRNKWWGAAATRVAVPARQRRMKTMDVSLTEDAQNVEE
jgi:hypothetical protein